MAHRASCPVPHHTTGCVGLRWKISMAHRASFDHILKEVGLRISFSVYNKTCFLSLNWQTKSCNILFNLKGMGLELKMFTTDTRT